MDPAANSCEADIVPIQTTHTTAYLRESRAGCPEYKHQRGWRRIVRNFTPSWFSVNMGTGVLSILLHNFPYNAAWLQYVSCILFAFNVLLFVVFSIITILRYTLYPSIWGLMIRHPGQSLFLGTFPMGLSTIINMVVFVCVPAWGGQTWKLAWALWWIDAIISVAVCISLPFILMTLHHQNVSTMTAAWLLPIVSTIVASGTGGVVATVIPDAQQSLITLIISCVLWAIGVPLSMFVLVIYFLRLTTVSLPPKEVVVSSFLPLGPLGQGGFAIMQIGKVALIVIPETDLLLAIPNAAEVFYVVSLFLGLIMWGYGLVWLCLALATITKSRNFPFNMGWWGFTFPIGVYTICTTTLANELRSTFFKDLGTIFSVAVALLWIVVSLGTVQRVYTGEIFLAPCLKGEEGDEHARQASNEAEKVA